MAKDLNPNDVSKHDVDEVFLATAGEVMYRRGQAKKDRKQIRDVNLAKAEQIVKEAKEKKK